MTVQELTQMAIEHDANLALAVSQLSQSVVAIGKELAIMQDEELALWKYVKDPNTNGDDRGCFKTWRDYARYRLGHMSTSKMYEYLSASSLTQGKKPLTMVEVQELGVKKAAQIARLPERKRTKKFVKEARDCSVAEVKKTVDEILEEEAPPSEKKVKLIPLMIALPQATIDLINEVEKDGVFMQEIRDGDRTWTLRAKLWHAVWVSFRASYQEELKAAAFARENQDAAKIEDQAEVRPQSVQ